jgi:hypothetical protein
MPDGVYLAGPLIALTMIAAMALALYRAFLHEPLSPRTARLKPDDTLPDGSLTSGALTGGALNGRLSDDTLPDVGSALVGPTATGPSGPDDYGLLVTATVAPTLADALLVQQHLRGAGIRTTLLTLPDERVRVLVFADALGDARRVVGS